jgi:hypothetical protein
MAPHNKKKYRSTEALVPVSKEAEFIRRCKEQLAKTNTSEAEEETPILGTSVLGDKTVQAAYMPKIRAFVDFLMENPQFDDSLVLFYNKTPKGTVTCQDIPVSYFLFSMLGEKSTPLKDFHVSIPLLFIYLFIFICWLTNLISISFIYLFIYLFTG